MCGVRMHSWKSSRRKRPLCPEAVASSHAHWHRAPVVGGQEARQGSIWLVAQMVPIQQGLFSQLCN